MNLTGMLTRPLEVTTPAEGGIGADGEWDPGAPTTVAVDGYVEQVSTTEVTVGQQTAPATWWAALPVGTPVTAESSLRIIDSDQRFVVAGDPAHRWNPWDRAEEFIRVELETVTASAVGS